MKSCARKKEINRVNFFCRRLQNHAMIFKTMDKNKLFFGFPRLSFCQYFYLLFLFEMCTLPQFLQKCINLNIPTYQVFYILKEKGEPQNAYSKYIDLLLKRRKLYNKRKMLHFLQFFREVCKAEGFLKEKKHLSSLILMMKKMDIVEPRTFDMLWVLYMGRYIPFDSSNFMYYDQTILHELLTAFHVLELSPKPLTIFFEIDLIANALADLGLSVENLENELRDQYDFSNFQIYFCLKCTGCLIKVSEKYEKKRRLKVENKINDLLCFSNSYTKCIRDHFYFQKKYWNISTEHLLKIYNVENEYRENEFSDVSQQLKMYFMY